MEFTPMPHQNPGAFEPMSLFRPPNLDESTSSHDAWLHIVSADYLREE